MRVVNGLKNVLRGIEDQFEEFKRTLVDLARIPSVSADGFPAEEVNRSLRAFVDGVTAAATGAIAGAAFVLGRRALVDLASVAIALAVLLVPVWLKKLPEPLLILSRGSWAFS